MIERPIMPHFRGKLYDTVLLLLITLTYIVVTAESNMYIPSFPQMMDYFHIGENRIQLILSINFAGLCIACLIAGPFSDSYGRRKVLLAGLLLFVVTSGSLVFVSDFKLILLLRLLQGVAASFPVVTGAAIFFDKYSGDKAGKVMASLNCMISFATSGAPIIGAWLSSVYHWKANFILIFSLSLVSFFGIYLFIRESLPKARRADFNLSSIFANYWKLFNSLNFICYTLIASLPFVSMVVYIANLSIIYINYMGLNPAICSYYQATTMGSFSISSLLTVRLISRFGVEKTKNLGGIIVVIGVVLLSFITIAHNDTVKLICLAMGIIAFGGAMLAGTFSVKAMSLFPEMNGTAFAFYFSIKQLLISSLVIISGIFFNGTILPITAIIASYALVITILYTYVTYKREEA